MAQVGSPQSGDSNSTSGVIEQVSLVATVGVLWPVVLTWPFLAPFAAVSSRTAATGRREALVVVDVHVGLFFSITVTGCSPSSFILRRRARLSSYLTPGDT